MVEGWEPELASLRHRLTELGVSSEAESSITNAAQRSARAIETSRSLLRSENLADSIDDVVAYGSLARFELTPTSDLDYLLVSAEKGASLDFPIGKLTSQIVPGVTLKMPGASGLFGEQVSQTELTDNIGLQEDTNSTLTRRILFLEESVSLFHPEFHRKILTDIISKYLTANRGSGEIPRFLINDVIRYWRTMAVDYQAKADKKGERGLRYLKLLIPRKLCFISSIAPLYQLHMEAEADQSQKLDSLVKYYSQPSVIRLSSLLADISQDDPGLKLNAKQIIETLALFIKNSEEPDWRAEVIKEADSADPNSTPNYGFMRSAAKQLHENVGILLLSERMKGFTQQFLVV